MECYAAVRRSVYVEGWSERAAARRFGLARETEDDPGVVEGRWQLLPDRKVDRVLVGKENHR